MKFTELGLHPMVMAGVEANQFAECTPIQESSIPHILSGHDLAGLAQTGTGKTAAFVLPLVDRIVRSREKVEVENPDRPIFKGWMPTHFILVLVPTRELAEQVYENVKKLGAAANVSATSIYGGTGYEGQKAALKKGVDFVVATPGRLIDLYKEHLLDLSQVRAIVFDEADRMFDMGFKDDMKFILRRVPQDRQFLVFSATLNFDVLNTAYEFGANPVEVNVSKDQAKADNVVDEIFHVGHIDKPKTLLSLIKKVQPKQAIIFSNFKHNVERIAKFLNANDIPAMGISSLISQSQRTRIMELFREQNNNSNILVATDVAARGLDIKGVDLVINFELPDDAENYVHRIGRTGRAGEKGTAYSLVGDRDVEALQRIESYLEHKITIGWIDDKDLVTEFKEFPREEGRRDFKRDSRPDSRGGGHQRGGPPRGGSHRGGQRPGPRDHRGEQQRGRPPRDGQRDHRGEQHSQNQNRNQNRSNQNRSNQQGRPLQQQQGQGNRPPQRHGRPNHQGGHPHRANGAPRPPRPNIPREGFRHKPTQTPPPPKTVAAKVSGFFKKLFGTE